MKVKNHKFKSIFLLLILILSGSYFTSCGSTSPNDLNILEIEEEGDIPEEFQDNTGKNGEELGTNKHKNGEEEILIDQPGNIIGGDPQFINDNEEIADIEETLDNEDLSDNSDSATGNAPVEPGLQSISISTGTLVKIDENHFYTRYSFLENINEITLSASTGPNTILMIDGLQYLSGEESEPIELSPGENIIKIEAVIENDENSIYEVIVNKDDISDFMETSYIKASNTDSYDMFGTSAALDGNLLVVGAPYESSDTQVINGDGSNNNAAYSGAAYVYDISAGNREQIAYLKPSDNSYGKLFGTSVSVSENIIAIGAPGDNGSTGSVYIFTKNSTGLFESAKLTASNSESGDMFGKSVAIHGNSLIVGAAYESSDSHQVNGTDNNNADNSGAAYLFNYKNGNWAQTAYLKASNSKEDDLFGWSVDISDDHIIVGAINDGSGSAYIFSNDGSLSEEEAHLKPDIETDLDRFGISVAVSGDNAVVGSYYEDGLGKMQSGAVYVFSKDSGSWAQNAYFKSENIDSGDKFGGSVDIEDDVLVIGAVGEDSEASGINGNGANNSRTGSGAAYVFFKQNGAWTQEAYIKASNPDNSDEFGHTVSLSNGRLAIGSRFEDGSSTGIDGSDNNGAYSSGAVYIFE